MLAPLRLLLWPLLRPLGRRVLLFAIAIGALWWWQGPRILRWLGPPRPPEGRIGLELDVATGPARLADLEQRFGARYRGAEPGALAATRAALTQRLERERAAAFAAERGAGRVLKREILAGGTVAMPPEVPAHAFSEVLLDPEESARANVAHVLWLDPARHAPLYELRDELAYVEHLFEALNSAPDPKAHGQ